MINKVYVGKIRSVHKVKSGSVPGKEILKLIALHPFSNIPRTEWPFFS